MIIAYNQDEFNSAKPSDKLPCICQFCNKIFTVEKRLIKYELKQKNSNRHSFCSIKCKNSYIHGIKISVNCINCNLSFEKRESQIKKHPNNFCSRSCSATYNNKNKTCGTKRSKLEKYIETQLTILYPNLHIDYNKKDTIGSELDIYIPTLKLAFELNGIFHYEPIFGSNKLTQIQNNDSNKFQKCLEHEISLCIIDTSSQKYFKDTTTKPFLDIIINIINNKLRTSLLTS